MDSTSNDQSDLAARLVKERRLLSFDVVYGLLRHFSIGDRLVLYTLSIILALSTLVLLAGVNNLVSTQVPMQGGSLHEGLIGPARFINPILALSDADEDLTKLVYSGLTRAQADGSIVPDLASSYSVSADGKVYTFTLRKNVAFQDGTPLTSADVLFTVQTAQNPSMKSPRRADWEGVVVSAPDDHTVIFTLPRAYAPFIENTTMGILPQHIWKDVTAEDFPFNTINTHPVGSGPYEVTRVTTDSTGSVTSYELTPFDRFTLGEGYLRHITFTIYPNSDDLMSALDAGGIDAVAGVSPEEVHSLHRRGMGIVSAPLPRVFGIFFNQTHAPVLADASAREALDAAIDKQRLVDLVLGGYGTPLSGPIPPTHTIAAATTRTKDAPEVSTAYTQDTLDQAKAILNRGGWTFDISSGTWQKSHETLSFNIATADAKELVATANAVATAWRQLGAKVTVQVYPLSDLNTSVIRPRNYDAVLFGEAVGRGLDLYAFWHSSQRNDPGLNLALYASTKADTLLSQARATTNAGDRDEIYTQFASNLEKDRPAVFLYAPDFLYIVPQDLEGIRLGVLTEPAERFLNVYQWYTDTERVWNMFAKEQSL